jgi:hypothetical protein
MSTQVVFCPGGGKSQSGTAVHERYPCATIETCGKISDVLNLIETNNGPYVIPIWNSHEGEVTAAQYVWDSITQGKIIITDAWAKTIDFWFVKSTSAETSYGIVGSVAVAGTQCSAFLKRKNLSLEKCDLTTVAFDLYLKGAKWDGVLVAPGQGEIQAGFEVIEQQTANPNNFTSFLRIIPSQALGCCDLKKNYSITGVRMPAFGVNFGEAEQSFFDQMLGLVKDLSDMPKPIFVFKREAKVGLLFEGMKLHAADLLDAEQIEWDDVSIYEDAGVTENLYTQALSCLFKNNFPDLSQSDFILHHGVNACLFACPPLNIYTHGYQVEAVEPVIRFYISRLFKLWDDGVKCTPMQIAFFEKYQNSWREKGSQFMDFKLITDTES